ncbi:thiamine pyrophosphate-binding protein, partial [Rhizobium leguminosarum]|uniref:thiamine pyrophosphate-binding protein n=1 Tax=Rhizobium leguminosarum TaxID=384 RepID=UPI001FEDA1AB
MSISNSSYAKSEQRKVKGSDRVVAVLEKMGAERIYGVPGEEILDIMESLRKSKIKFVPTRTEWGAALMAATEGRLT